MNPQFDSKTIETLKAARNQILTDTANPRKVNPVRKSEALDPAAPSFRTRNTHFLYDILLDYVVGHLKVEFEKAAIHLEKPLTAIVSGGTAKPNGFLKRFQKTLERFELPIEFGEITFSIATAS